PELPSKLLQVRQRAALSSLFGFTKNTTAVSYIPKRGRNVLLSSKHRDPAVTEEEKRKPVIIADYNHCKGAVDNLDKVLVSRYGNPVWPAQYNIPCISSTLSFWLLLSISLSSTKEALHGRSGLALPFQATLDKKLYGTLVSFGPQPMIVPLVQKTP
ncbi:hypothetical protein JOQ06_007052, partial [Pogonophryne albipinna]